MANGALKFKDLRNPWQRFRSQTGLSQVELAKEMNLVQSAISSYECGSFPEPAIAKRFVSIARRHKVRMSLEEIYAELEPA